jgi:UDP-glucose 4-epimerase
VSKIFEDNDIDAVVHFAAYSQVGESIKDPYKYYLNNTVKTTMLLDEMRRTRVNKIVFSSTAATYGTPEKMPIEENTPQNPINPYGKSKLMIEIK